MSAHPPRRPARDWPIPPMDKGSGWKDTAFTWAMGHLILQPKVYRAGPPAGA